jgi:pyridoxal phosphate enzyme (YggS family)
MSDALLTAWRQCLGAIDRVADGRRIVLVAVGKTQPVAAIRTLAAAGQHHFGENYVQEALPKIAACADLAPTWHFIGPLQSNKCREVAQRFDWVQSVDRRKLVSALARHRPASSPPLNVLMQVNIDDEASKSGCAPGEVEHLADTIAAEPRLCLRGLMAIPRPYPDPRNSRESFAAMRALFDGLKARHDRIDTLSIGMSDDFAEAIQAGATMVRVGSALFGSRAPTAR